MRQALCGACCGIWTTSILPIPEGVPARGAGGRRRGGARYAAAMADRSLWGLAKFWITTAAEQGVDVHDEQALQDFVGRAQGGEVPYDPEVLQTIVERHRRSSGPVRSEPQLPVALPGDDVLREQAGRSPVLRQLRELAEWAGRDRRTLTGSGRLRLSDARELVERLNTGDDTDAVRSSADLPRLNLLVEWAKTARLIRVAKGGCTRWPRLSLY